MTPTSREAIFNRPLGCAQGKLSGRRVTTARYAGLEILHVNSCFGVRKRPFFDNLSYFLQKSLILRLNMVEL